MTSLPMETLQELPPFFKHVDGTHMVFLHTFKVLLQRFPSTQFAREKERERSVNKSKDEKVPWEESQRRAVEDGICTSKQVSRPTVEMLG